MYIYIIKNTYRGVALLCVFLITLLQRFFYILLVLALYNYMYKL